MMKQRKEKIKDDIGSAEKLRLDAEKILAEYQKKLDNMAKEKERIFSATREEADSAKEELMKAAQQEVSELREKVLMELRDEKNAIMKELRGEIIETAMQVSGKVLAENAQNIIQKTKYEQMLEFLEKSKGAQK
jgi:F-type H+-transporting ATPase subunit b